VTSNSSASESVVTGHDAARRTRRMSKQTIDAAQGYGYPSRQSAVSRANVHSRR
jgi:hypothetical protein